MRMKDPSIRLKFKGSRTWNSAVQRLEELGVPAAKEPEGWPDLCLLVLCGSSMGWMMPTYTGAGVASDSNADLFQKDLHSHTPKKFLLLSGDT